MLNSYLLVEKDALPEYFLKVIEAKKLLESGKCAQIADAVQVVGISRSTYYKYRDKVLEPEKGTVGRKATITLNLSDEAGMLSKLMGAISQRNANILTLTQSLPIHGWASVMMTIDSERMTQPIEDLLDSFRNIIGVENIRLLSVE